MAESVSGQDEANPAFWLATRAVKIGPSCPLGISRVVPRKKEFCFWPYNKSFIDQACSDQDACTSCFYMNIGPLFFVFLLPSTNKNV